MFVIFSVAMGRVGLIQTTNAFTDKINGLLKTHVLSIIPIPKFALDAKLQYNIVSQFKWYES